MLYKVDCFKHPLGFCHILRALKRRNTDTDHGVMKSATGEVGELSVDLRGPQKLHTDFMKLPIKHFEKEFTLVTASVLYERQTFYSLPSSPPALRKIEFGQNNILRSLGWIKVNSAVRVLPISKLPLLHCVNW